MERTGGRGRRGLWLLVAGLTLNPLTLAVLGWWSLRPVVAVGPSMRPTLNGDPGLGFESRWSYRLHDPHRGDIASIASPITEPALLAKRVIGLPGETIAIVAGTVLIDGVPLKEPYVTFASSEDVEPWLLGSNEYWVMGDNRRDSMDSRAFGPVLREEFRGEIAGMFWPPADANAAGLGLLALLVGPPIGLSFVCGAASLRTGRRRGLGRRSACWGVFLWLLGCWLVAHRPLRQKAGDGFIGPQPLRLGRGYHASTAFVGFTMGGSFGSTFFGWNWFLPSGLVLTAVNVALLHLPGSPPARARRGSQAIMLELHWCLASWLLGQITSDGQAGLAAVVVAVLPFAARRIHGAIHLVPAPSGRWAGWLALLRSVEAVVIWCAVVAAFLPVERAGGFALLGAAAAVMSAESARERDFGWFPLAAIAVALAVLSAAAASYAAEAGSGLTAAGLVLLAFIVLDLRRDGAKRLRAESVHSGGGLRAPA